MGQYNKSLSDHLCHRDVRVLEEGLPLVGEAGDGCAVQNSVIAAEAHVYYVPGDELPVFELGNCLEFADSHYAGLRGQNQRVGHDSAYRSDV